jgi:O-acetyl-ADP-ribose deacetylase (regulator of RNase III)
VTRLEAVEADITNLDVDVIVNAANSSLTDGAGVNGAIHRAGGPVIGEECQDIVATLEGGRLPTGEAVVTTAGNMPAGHVVHTVGPIWGNVAEDEAVRLLASCYRTSLDLAKKLSAATVAFPNISTGIYGFPKPLAATTAVGAVREWVDGGTGSIESILFVCFDRENLGLYRDLLAG